MIPDLVILNPACHYVSPFHQALKRLHFLTVLQTINVTSRDVGYKIPWGNKIYLEYLPTKKKSEEILGGIAHAKSNFPLLKGADTHPHPHRMQ